MKHKNLLALILVGAQFALIGCGKSDPPPSPKPELTLAERYPGPWVSDVDLAITRALIRNNVSGCGQYKYRSSSQNSGEYLVYCSRDGETWTAYIVWPNVEKAMGPLAPDPSLN
mgnify:CR=1 FL=1